MNIRKAAGGRRGVSCNLSVIGFHEADECGCFRPIATGVGATHPTSGCPPGLAVPLTVLLHPMRLYRPERAGQ